ncbi:MAG: YniB family protein [Marinomonas foliarum]
MNYKDAKRKAISKKVIGLAIVVPTLISTVISLLRMLYFRIDDGTQMGSALAKPIKQLVSLVYENTHFLDLFWMYSPIPNQMNLKDTQNFYFITIYVLLFIGYASFGSGRKLSHRLRVINQKIEDQLIHESIKGIAGRSRVQIEESTIVTAPTIFSQIHQLYIAAFFKVVVA